MAVHRRTFLNGVTLGAGAHLLGPVLGQLEAQAAGAARPTRFVFVTFTNGILKEAVQPQGVTLGGDKQTKTAAEPLGAAKLHPNMDALEPYRDKVTVVQGLSGTCAVSTGHTSGFAALSAVNEKVKGVQETVDGALAKKLGGVFPHVGLELVGESVVHTVSALGPGKPLPMIARPDLAFNTLFGLAGDGPAARSALVKPTLLDGLSEDLKRVRAGVGAAERAKLDAHLEAYEALRDRQSRLAAMRDVIRAAAPPVTDKYTSANEADRLDANFDLAAAALIGGLTNVVTLASGCGSVWESMHFRSLGFDTAMHGVGHSPDYRTKMDKVYRLHLDQTARLVKKLTAVPEGNGTLMDNTLVVLFSEFGDGHHPSRKDWPFVLVGDLGGRLKAGRVVQYPFWGRPGHRTINHLYTTLLHLAGDPRPTFGDHDPRAVGKADQGGPLSELLA